MQQQELEEVRQREANLTALAAIGPRKKRRIDDTSTVSASSLLSPKGLGPKALDPLALTIFTPVVPPWPWQPLAPDSPEFFASAILSACGFKHPYSFYGCIQIRLLCRQSSS